MSKNINGFLCIFFGSGTYSLLTQVSLIQRNFCLWCKILTWRTILSVHHIFKIELKCGVINGYRLGWFWFYKGLDLSALILGIDSSIFPFLGLGVPTYQWHLAEESGMSLQYLREDIVTWRDRERSRKWRFSDYKCRMITFEEKTF